MNERDTLRQKMDELLDAELRTATRLLVLLRVAGHDPVP